MPLITKDQLHTFARNTDVELRLVEGVGDQGPRVETREGTWHGRLMRWYKMNDGNEDRTEKQKEYGGLHKEVYRSLKEIYGPEIAERAFRAGGFGRQDRDGEWTTNTNHPLTGRHIARMLETAEREVQRNSGIAGWISGIRKLEGAPPNVLLGQKVSVPQGRLPIEEAFGNISTELGEDREKWLSEGNETHGLWILDLGVRGQDRVRVGLHSVRDDPGVFSVFHGGNEYIVPRKDLGEWLHAFSLEHFPSGVSDVSLHRGEVDIAGGLVEEARHELRPHLNHLIDWLDRGGVKQWTSKALVAIDEGSKLLRSRTGEPRDPEAFQEQINLVLGDIGRSLNDIDTARPQEILLHQRQAIKDMFGGLMRQQDELLGLGNQLRDEIHLALVNEAENYLGQMRIERQSLTDDGTRQGLLVRLGLRLELVLAGTTLSDEERQKISLGMKPALEQALTQLNEENFKPHEAALDVIAPFNQRVMLELQRLRVELEARSNELEVEPIEVVEREHVETKSSFRPSWARTMGGIEFREGDDLHEVMPLMLRFRQQGEETIAEVPNLFGNTTRTRVYDQTGERSLTMGRLVEGHETRLSGDKAGVPGSGQEQTLSTRLMERMGSDQLVLQGRDGIVRLLAPETLSDLRILQDEDGNFLELSDEQFCGLTRFLDDSAFLEMYEQVVSRTCPPGTSTECNGVGIIVRLGRDDNQRQTIDITFRATFPDGDDLRYQALDQDGVVPRDQPVRTIERDDILVSSTLHVPLDQLQEGRPRVTLDQPVLVVREGPI